MTQRQPLDNVKASAVGHIAPPSSKATSATMVPTKEIREKTLEILRVRAELNHDTPADGLIAAARDADWVDRRRQALRDALAEWGGLVLEAALGPGPSPLDPDYQMAVQLAAREQQRSTLPTANTPPQQASEFRQAGSPHIQTQTQTASDPTGPTGSATPSERSAPAPTIAVTETIAAQLEAKLSENQNFEPSPTASPTVDPARAATVIRASIDILGPTPEALDDDFAIDREVGRLLEATRSHRLEQWHRAGTATNRNLGNWVAARARAAQQAADELALGPARDRLSALFPALSHHSKLTQPGTIFGLARAHNASTGGGWLERARRAESSLRELESGPEQSPKETPPVRATARESAKIAELLRQLAEASKGQVAAPEFRTRLEELIDAGLPAGDPRLVQMALGYAAELDDPKFRLLRRAIRKLSDPEENSSSAAVMAGDWPYFEFTRGKHAVMVGGEPRPQRVETLENAFEFASLEWIARPTTGSRQVDPIVERMRNGNLDVVIGLRAFCSHAVTHKLFHSRASGCLVVLAHSYGLEQVKQAIERYAPTLNN